MIKNRIKILIVDDEELSREGIKFGLENIFKDRNELLETYEASNTEEADVLILKHKPSIVLLDIEMPKENGIDFLARQKNITFDVIILTAYEEYAVAAFKHHAQDYLLKPFNEKDFKDSIHRCLQNRNLLVKAKKYTYIKEMIQIASSKKIALPTQQGFEMVKIASIIYLKASGSYTDIYIKDSKKQKIAVSKNIKYYENILNGEQFIRVHDSYIVNKEYIDKYIKGDGGYLILEDGTSIDVSKRKKARLIDKLLNRNIES